MGAGGTEPWKWSAPPAAPLPMESGAEVTRPRWTRTRERIAMAAALAVTATTFSLIAVHDNDAAAKWRRLDQAQIRISTGAGQQVQSANASITLLNAEVKSLQSQVSNMQGQLSSVANQKEKALDQTTVFRDLLAAAGQVANNLEGCISASNQLENDINAAVAARDVAALSSLQTEASSVNAACAQAQQGNDALQTAIQSAS